MTKRKRRTRKPRSRPFSPFIVLALWLAVLAVGVLSLETPPQTLAQVDDPAEAGTGPQMGRDDKDRSPTTPRHDDSNPATRVLASDTDGPGEAVGGTVRAGRTPAASVEWASTGSATSRKTAASPSPPRRSDTTTASTAPASPEADLAKLETPGPATGIVDPTRIARARFTTGIEAREPIDQVENVFPSQGQAVRTLYYFTEVTNMTGETVTHRWEYEGEVIASVPFEIGSANWRTWSSKDLRADMPGRWRVIVTDDQGQVLATDSFTYQ